MFDVINPATGERLYTFEEDNTTSLQQKMIQLQKAQPGWYAEGLSHRLEVLSRFRDLLESTLEEGARILTAETGKPIRQSRNEIQGARSRIRWMLDNAGKYLADEVMYEAEGLQEMIRYEPLGVIGNISAWNYPYLVGVNVIVPALLAGNAVMYKPSEYATATGKHILSLLYQAGVSHDVMQLAAGGKATGEALLDLPLDGYFFTGSYATGHAVYQRVAPRLVPCQLELGGKDPLYVADDVQDIQAVAAAVADGAFYNNGQSCCAVERIYVHEKVADAFINAFVAEVKGYKQGDPMAEDTYLGALTRPAQITLLEQQVSDALAGGAVLACGGKRATLAGNFFEPTVLTQVNHSMRVMREESFGPIIGIMSVSSDAEALQWMNDTEYGLTAAVYTASAARAQYIMEGVHTGTAYWNCCDRVSAALPWSGRKHSGIGATLSHQGLRAFAQPKALHRRLPA